MLIAKALKYRVAIAKLAEGIAFRVSWFGDDFVDLEVENWL